MARSALQDPLKVFRYRVVVDFMISAAFSELTGVKSTTDVAEIREGGNNETPLKSPGLTKYDNITMKRGQIIEREQGGSGGGDDFLNWVQAVHYIGSQGQQQAPGNPVTSFRQDFGVHQYTSLNTFGRGWNFFNAWPVSYMPFTDLNGLGSENSFESIEVAYEGFKAVLSL